MAKSQAKTVEAQAEQSTDNTNGLTIKSLYKTKSAIDNAINAAKVSTMLLQDEYQKIGCSTLNHLYEHKDITVIRNLMENFPAGLRGVAMYAFIEKFAPVKFERDKTTRKTVIHFSKERHADMKLDNKEVREATLQKAIDTFWNDMAPNQGKEPAMFDLEARLKIVAKQARKALDDAASGVGPKAKVTTDQVLKLEQLIGSIESAKPDKVAAVQVAA